MTITANAMRQAKFKERQTDAGRVRLCVWLDYDALEALRELASVRRLTVDRALELAIWSDAANRGLNR